MNTAMLLAHELLCAVLIYTVFCRSVRMDHTVRLDVRLAFFLMGVVACLGMPAPLIWPAVPTPFTILLLIGIVVVQAVTARYWRHGVPANFYKTGCRPHPRCDRRGGCREP